MEKQYTDHEAGQEQLEQECIAYFRTGKVWERLFRGFCEKYRSYGHFSGTVVLRDLSADDIEALEGFFEKSYHGKKSASISAERFQRALEHSRYGGVSPEWLLAHFFEEPLLSKQEELQCEAQNMTRVLERFLQTYEGTPVSQMMESLLAVVNKCRTKNWQEWERLLELGAAICNQFPYREQKTMYLAVFATQLTGNPHAFDAGTAEGAFLYQLAQRDLAHRGILVEHSELFPAFTRQRCLLQVGILLDDVSNSAMLSGVRAKKRDGSFHRGMDGFFEAEDMVQIPLAVLAQWEQIVCRDNEMYIVENPSVFASLCGERGSQRSYMCMNGQPRLAGLVVLDLLAAAGTTVYYAGDLDPEGLLIAQKLAHYYRDIRHGSFHYWQLTPEDYQKSRSMEVISEKRLKMLERITDEELLPVVQLMREARVAGYQEKLL